MKKIIPFTNDIKFNTKIYEITSISLENTLSATDNNTIDGEFIISGDYKMNDSSINTEPFIYGLPFNITLDTKYDTENLKIDIDDFKFEIVNEEILRVNIDVLIEGVELIEVLDEEKLKPDVIIEARKEKIEEENDESNNRKEDYMDDYVKDLFKQTDENITQVDQIINNDVDSTKVTSIFENFDPKDEKYVSYYVHIVRENDNIDSICLKYGINSDDLKEYNDIDQITLGNKIIIPYKNNETI